MLNPVCPNICISHVCRSNSNLLETQYFKCSQCFSGCYFYEVSHVCFLFMQSGWWYTYPSEKCEFVSWDDDIPNIWTVIKFMFQTTNQQYSLTILAKPCSIPRRSLVFLVICVAQIPVWIGSKTSY